MIGPESRGILSLCLGMELHHPIMSKLWDLGGRTKRKKKNIEKLDFVSSSTVYEDNNVAVFLEKIPRMIHTSNHIAVKYRWFRQHVRK